jgi:tRNA G18 (ribose-2'-O)-methylase SpoU
MRKLSILEMNRLSVEEFHEAEKMPLVVVLDDVRSLYNVGSVFRTCDAFRVEAVYLCGITATPPHVEIHKTALGAEDSVSWRYFKTADEAVEELKQRGYYTYAVEQAEGSTKLQDLKTLPPAPPGMEGSDMPLQDKAEKLSTPLHTGRGRGVGLVLGNEVKGVHQSVIDACDDCLEIPQFGTKHSMNVSVTAGIVIWEFARRMLLGK